MGYRRGHTAVGGLLVFLMLLAGCAAPAEPASTNGAAAAGPDAPSGHETSQGAAPWYGSVTGPDTHTPWRRWAQTVFGVDAQRVWVAGDGLIMASADGGTTWRLQWRGDSSVSGLYFLDPRTGWAVTAEGILATTDGETWTAVSDQPLDAVQFLDGATGYGLSREQGLFFTADGGRTWQSVPAPDDLQAVCFTSPDTGWATDRRSIYRTGGVRGVWEKVAAGPTADRPDGRTWTGEWVDIACPAADALWARASFGAAAGSEDWGVFRSTDGGSTWTLVAGRVKGNHLAARPGPWAVVSRETVLMAGTGADRLAFEGTCDGGETWSGALYAPETYTARGTETQDRLCGWPLDLSFSDPRHGWVLNDLPAPGWDLLRTADGGQTWEPVALPPMPEDAAAGSSGRTLQLPTRAEWRARIARALNEGSGSIADVLSGLADPASRSDEVPWLSADLDGDGAKEYVLAAEVQDGDERWNSGAALCVIDRRDDAWAVECAEPMDPALESSLMAPHLHAAADLTGSGRPQIVWFRRELIASGPQPHVVFVTAWEPGRFTHLPGQMVLGDARVAIDGTDVVLTGNSRRNTYLPVTQRTDRYRYVNGEFRLVDRRFDAHPENGYARLWDGLVAEDVGRVTDALTAYRQAADPDLPAHSGEILRYNAPPRELSGGEVDRFGDALRTFARFRLGALLLAEGREEEALATLAPDGPYAGLLEAARRAGDRPAACRAAADWAAANPAFLEALNLGVGTAPWTPGILCGHVDIDDRGPWE